MENKQLFEKQGNGYNPFFPIVRLEDIIETITDKSIQWIFNNYNHIYVEYSESREITRNKVPQLLRRSGLWISYNNGKDNITEHYIGENTNVNNYVEWTSDDNWKKFDELTIQDKSITYQHLSDALRQLVAGGNTITNFPDEEDITTSGGVLSFKDRNYDPNTFSGLGRVILRKNLKVVDVQPKNILTQDMINKENTIYEIRYDFDLNDTEITIPEGCVLDFQGGSLSNGEIIGNNTKIIHSNQYIFEGIHVRGTWIISVIESLLFKDIEKDNVIKELFNLTNDSIHNDVYLENKIFNISVSSENVNAITISSNTNVYNTGILHLSSNNLGNYSIINIIKNNIIFEGGKIEGDIDTHTGTTGEWGHGIIISNNAKNTIIKNVEIVKCWGDGINVAGNSQNVLIDSCYVHDCGRLGLSVTYGSYITINNCKIENITRTEPKACIDIEPNSNNEVSHVVISNCIFSNTDDNRSVIITSLSDVKLISNVIIENCTFEGSKRCLQIHNRTEYDTMQNFIVRNNKFNKVNGLGIYFNRLKNLIFENNEAVSINKDIQSSDDCLLYFNRCKTTTCKNNRLNSYLNGIVLVYSEDAIHEIKITDNIIDAYGSVTNNSYANIENNTITIYNPITLYGCWRNNIIKTSNDFTGRIFSLEGRGCLINNTIEINSPNEVVPVYCGGFNIIKNNTFVSNLENANIPNIIGSRSSAERVICINNNFDNINPINKYIAEDGVSNGRYYIEHYNKKWGSTAPENPEGGASYYNHAVRAPMWYHIGRDIWVNSQGVDMNGVTSVIGHDQTRKDMQLNKSNIGLQYYDTHFKLPVWWNGEYWVTSDKHTIAAKVGLSNARPLTLRPEDIGYTFYDKTLNKLICADSITEEGVVTWLDANGNNADDPKRGSFLNKPVSPSVGFAYFCTDRKTAEGTANGIMIYHKGNDVWVDALGRVVE